MTLGLAVVSLLPYIMLMILLILALRKLKLVAITESISIKRVGFMMICITLFWI